MPWRRILYERANSIESESNALIGQYGSVAYGVASGMERQANDPGARLYWHMVTRAVSRATTDQGQGLSLKAVRPAHPAREGVRRERAERGALGALLMVGLPIVLVIVALAQFFAGAHP